MVGAWTAGNVDVFSQLDVAVGSEDGQPPVTPIRQPIGRIPVDPCIAAAAVAPQQHLAEILEVGIAAVGEVADRSAHDLRVLGAGKGEELIDLMAADIAQDSAILVAPEEPGWAQVPVEPVRAKSDGLHDAADRADRYKLESPRNDRRLEPSVAYRPEPRRLSDNPA